MEAPTVAILGYKSAFTGWSAGYYWRIAPMGSGSFFARSTSSAVDDSCFWHQLPTSALIDGHARLLPRLKALAEMQPPIMSYVKKYQCPLS